MNILVTAVEEPLSSALREALSGSHALTFFDTGSTTDAPAVWQSMRGKGAVLHGGQMPESLSGDDETRRRTALDLHTRGAHVLLKAAVDAGVRRAVVGSTLDLFADYPDDVYITEHWRPLPSDDTAQMGPFLTERVAMEFAREHAISVTVLRLGRLVSDPADSPRQETADRSLVPSPSGEGGRGRPSRGREGSAGRGPEGGAADPIWLDPRDAARAFRAALDRDTSGEVNWMRRFNLHHIVAAHANPRFLLGGARFAGGRPLPFQPVHNFAGR